MYQLPTEITLNDETVWHIRDRGDFRMVLDCFEVFNDETLTTQEKMMITLIIFYDLDDMDELEQFSDIEDAYMKMMEFMDGGKAQSNKHRPKLIDWEKDSAFIFAAVNNVANKEVRAEEYLHWWTFMGYYMSIGESALSTIVSIRDKLVKGKKLEKYELEYKNDNPEYFDWDFRNNMDIELDNMVRELWNANSVEDI